MASRSSWARIGSRKSVGPNALHRIALAICILRRFRRAGGRRARLDTVIWAAVCCLSRCSVVVVALSPTPSQKQLSTDIQHRLVHFLPIQVIVWIIKVFRRSPLNPSRPRTVPIYLRQVYRSHAASVFGRPAAYTNAVGSSNDISDLNSAAAMPTATLALPCWTTQTFLRGRLDLLMVLPS